MRRVLKGGPATWKRLDVEICCELLYCICVPSLSCFLLSLLLNLLFVQSQPACLVFFFPGFLLFVKSPPVLSESGGSERETA